MKTVKIRLDGLGGMPMDEKTLKSTSCDTMPTRDGSPVKGSNCCVNTYPPRMRASSSFLPSFVTSDS